MDRSLFIFLCFISCTNSTPKNELSSSIDLAEYQLVKDWPQLPNGFVLGNPTGIGIDSNQNIFVFHRAERKWTEPFPDSMISSSTILMIDHSTGELINAWGENLFIMPHGLTVDHEDNIWVTDVGLHQVFKFSHDGKLIMKLGEARVAGNDSAHFNLPTDVAVAGDGSFYVSDGYGNSRVVKFSASGKYLFAWGKKGNQAGEFNIPHAIDLDASGNVYVADRGNSRVQAFDPNGKYLNTWGSADFGKIYAVTIDKPRGDLLAIDYAVMAAVIPEGSDVIIFDAAGKQVNRFGRSGRYDGPISRYHDIEVDREGNIYVGDILGNGIQKFRKIKKE